MNNKSTLSHFLEIGIGVGLNMLLTLISTPIITRIVDPKEYGEYSMFTMYSSIALTILCLGLDQSFVRFFYEKEDLEYKRDLLFRCIYPTVIGMVFISIIVIALSIYGLFEFDFVVTLLLCAFTLIQIIYRFSLLVVRLQFKSKLFSVINVMHKASFILFAIPSLLMAKNNYFIILVVSTIMSVFTCVLVSMLCEKDIWNFTDIKIKNNDFSQKELLKYAAPFIISMSVVSLFQAIDKISLDYYCSYIEVGIYSSTLTLIGVFAIVQSTFNTLWAPMAVERFTKHPEDKEFHQRGNRMITVVMFFVGLTLILTKDIFAFLLGSKYREAAYILPFLIFNPIMYTVSETTVGGLVFYKKSNMQVWVAVISCISNIIGNVILVPRLGCKGAAISTGLSYIIFFTFRTLFANKYYPLDLKLGKFYLLTFVTIGYAAYNTFVTFNYLSVVGYVICILILIVLYWNAVKEIVDYIKDFIGDLFKKRYKILR